MKYFFIKKKVLVLKNQTIKSLFLVLVFLLLFNCASTAKKPPSITEFNDKPISQVGTVNNPRYFGKQFDSDTPVERVTVEGRSQILESGEQNAYEAALDHALRNAVEIVLGTMIDNHTLVNNGVLIQDKIYSRAYGFVKTYKVVEEFNRNNTKFLRVWADVVIGDVRDDAMALGILQDRSERPLMVLAIDEKDMDNQPSKYLNNELEKILVNRELQLINIDIQKHKDLISDPIAVGIQHGAQIMVYGNVNATINDLSKHTAFKGKNIKSVNVSIALKAFNLGDGRILSSRQLRDNGVGLDVNTALKNGIEKIAKKLGDNLVDDFIKKWDLYVNNGFEYSVIFEGANYNQVKKIKDYTPRRIQGIKAIFDKGFENKIFRTLIRFQGNVEELTRAMTIQFRPEIKLKLKKYNANSIEFYLE